MERDFARKQIFRMAQLGGFPEKYVEAVGELIDALMKAPTEEYARDVITSFVEDADGETRCPFPKDIRYAINRLLDAREGEIQADPCCPMCKGIGEILVDYPDGSSASRGRCTCFARRPPIDYSKLPGVEKFDMRAMVAEVAARKAGKL